MLHQNDSITFGKQKVDFLHVGRLKTDIIRLGKGKSMIINERSSGNPIHISL